MAQTRHPNRNKINERAGGGLLSVLRAQGQMNGGTWRGQAYPGRQEVFLEHAVVNGVENGAVEGQPRPSSRKRVDPPDTSKALPPAGSAVRSEVLTPYSAPSGGERGKAHQGRLPIP